MNTKSFREKYREMCRSIPKMLREYERAALKSGAFDLPSTDDNYLLPKAVIAAALQECSEQYRLLDSASKKTVQNIRLCTSPNFANC
jgi:hypothetical protein